jgi:hypothetical protein
MKRNCPDCKPGFLSKPLWFVPTQAGTCSVWQFVVFIHVLYLMIFPLLLDCGILSVPASIYSLTVLLYFAVRFGIARFKGYPILTRLQAFGLLALPAYGLAGFLTLFYFVQRLRYGE